MVHLHPFAMSKTPVSPLKSVPLQSSALRFWHRGQILNHGNVPPDRTLLDLLREDLRLSPDDPFATGFALSDTWGPQVGEL